MGKSLIKKCGKEREREVLTLVLNIQCFIYA